MKKGSAFTPEDEICANCAKYSNLHISGEEQCKYAETLFSYQPGPVPCVHFTRFPEYEIIVNDNHVWKKSSTNFAHMNGVSMAAWCTKCGAEVVSGMPPSNRCRDIKITHKYKSGGTYKKSCSPEWLKRNS